MSKQKGGNKVRNLEKINEHIYELCIPYKDIFTTVYFIKTESGVLLFDTASYDCDVTGAIIPALRELEVGKDDLKYVFISHNHTDHAGGLGELLKAYPKACVVSKSESLKEKFEEYTFLSPNEGERLLDVFSVVSVTGHTKDSAALYDIRTKTLISGDCLQLYGIFGSGFWGANISFFTEYAEAIRKLRKMDIDTILTAHDYHPCGRKYFSKAEVDSALDACLAPFDIIQKLIEESPDASDERICEIYNSQNNLPKLGAHVVRKYRESFKATDNIS
jgi:glyoxylase-like metal-dependent hydrolase (beta-lactamase superfamily II)